MIETAIATLWSEALGIEGISTDDSFFALGGDEKSAQWVTDKIWQTLAVRLPVAAVLAADTLAQFAQKVRARRRFALSSMPPVQRHAALELSFAQQRLWFLSQLGGSSAAYHVSLALRLRGALKEHVLQQALDRLLVRHESLRTTFYSQDGTGYQKVASQEAGFPLTHGQLPMSPGHEQLAALVHEQMQAAFDLEKGPLIRGHLARIASDDHALVLTMHHIVADGWSMAVLVRELGTLYAAFAQGLADPLPVSAIQYPDYAAWQRRWLSSDALADHGTYWREALAGAPALLELPLDHKRPAEQDFCGGYIALGLDEGLTADLKALSRRRGLTLFMTVLAGWALTLSRLSGQDDVVVGTPVANRTRAEVEELIGFFVNTVAVRVDLSGAPTVDTLLLRVREATLGAQEHQDLPFEQVVELLRPTRNMAHSPIFQVMFAWQNNESPQFDAWDLTASEIAVPAPTAQFDMTLILSEVRGKIVGGINFSTALFSPETVHRYADYLRQALSAMVADPSRPARTIALLPEEELRLLTVQWNRTDAPYPADQCIHQLFERQAQATPDAIAVVFEDRSLSYAQLNTQANRLAHQLIAQGVRPDDRVAICVERSFALVVGLLAILKAGGAYVPLDPAYPAERLGHIVQDAAPALLLADRAGRAALPQQAIAHRTVLALDPAPSPWADQPANNPDPAALGLQASHLAYVIYTSGSTGTPKGVMVEHRSVTNQIHALQELYGLTDRDRILQFASSSFDVSVEEIFGALLSGAALVLRTDAWLASVACFGELCATHGITIAELPNAFWGQLASAQPRVALPGSLRQIVIGGEAVSLPALEAWFDGVEHRPALFNAYGPTETTINATLQKISSHGIWTSIGRPIANTRIYVLDAAGQPVPRGVGGELYIGGAGVARGYLNRPGLTAERFLVDPFRGEPAARMYKTGDLVRYLPDGSLEFLGRNDQQVKIRGFRIELGEIEARLAEHPAVHEAVVVARKDGGEQRLVAYVLPTLDHASTPVDWAAALRTHLNTRLPDYMVPAAFVRLDAWPMTPNGKLDHRALPAPAGDAYVRHAYEVPQGAMETTLAQLWEDLLGIEKVGRHDNFFELGGHSLLAVRLLSRLAQATGTSLPLAALFAHPTLAALAAVVDQAVVSADVRPAPSMTPVARAGKLPLSFAQQRLWFLAQFDQRISATYHMPVALRLHGPLDVPALRRAMNVLWQRHEALRTVFVESHGEPYIELLPPDPGLPLIEHDLREAFDASGQLESLSQEEVASPFDLARGPLIRGRLIQLRHDEYVGLLTLHHIVSDGWSVGVLFDELSRLYRAFTAGQDNPLPPLAIQYPDYAVWQRAWLAGERLQHQVDYWRRQLADAPVLLALPTDRPRPARQSFAGAGVAVVIDAGLTQRLKRLGQQYGCTLYMTVLAAWASVLARLSGQQDLIIGTPTANRARQELEPLIGFFVNTLALRIDLTGEPGVAELLARVRETALAAQDHQDLPFEQVVEIVQPPRQLSHSPLFQVMFAWQNDDGNHLDLPGLDALPIEATLDTVKFDLALSLSETADGMVGRFAYATALFDADTIERQRGYLIKVLQAMVADASQPVSRIDMLSAAERDVLLYDWNHTEAAYPHDQCIHERFEQQVRASPDALAIVDEDRRLSYAELNGFANRLAHRMIALGVQPGDHVAIVLERSAALIVAELAILKAGATYVPIDPQIPATRQVWLIADCNAKIIIAQDELVDDSIRILAVDLTPAEGHQAGDPALTLSSGTAAYVMYTSGTTGTPKGVVIPHRAVNRLVVNSGYAEFQAGDRIAFAANPAFDASTFEVWGALLNGGACIVFDQATLLTPERFRDALQATRVNVMWLTVGLFNQVADTLSPIFGQLRVLMVGGDRLDPKVIAQVLHDRAPQRLLNGYGPTETTTFATTYTIADCDGQSPIPIGRPIANTQVYLLDAHRQPVPLGAVGELHVGGAGVACGYLNRPDLTAQRFLPDPFSGVPDARMYRTGDQARYRPDGNIEFLGRNDQQVKLRGYRIELGEIEAQLVDHPAVHEAAVMLREDLAGDKRLVAYVVAGPGATIDVSSLREHLAWQLPDYMLPAAFVRLPQLPLNANGKLDRKALPAPEDEAYARHAYEPPQGEIEATLTQLWEALLGVDKISRHDNFFALGGHSLLATRLINRIRITLNADVSLHALFETPTIAGLARQLGQVA